MEEPLETRSEAARRLALAADVAAFSDTDAALVRASAKAVTAVREALAAAVYDHLLSMPETARWFLHSDGTPDEAALAERRRTLADWLALVASADLREDTARALVRIGRAHATPATAPAGPIPPTLMVATIAFAQAAIAGVLRDALGPARGPRGMRRLEQAPHAAPRSHPRRVRMAGIARRLPCSDGTRPLTHGS